MLIKAFLKVYTPPPTMLVCKSSQNSQEKNQCQILIFNKVEALGLCNFI